MNKDDYSVLSTQNNTCKDIDKFDHLACEVWINCAKYASALGSYNLAIANYEKALEINPSNVYALCGLSYLMRKINASNVEVFKIIENFKKCFKIYPNLVKNYLVFKELAELYLVIGMDDFAFHSVQTAIQLSPLDSSLWLSCSKILMKSGNLYEAAGTLAHCLSFLTKDIFQLTYSELETAKSAYMNLALISFFNGHYSHSIYNLNKALSYPNSLMTKTEDQVIIVCALILSKETIDDLDDAFKICESAINTFGFVPKLSLVYAYLLILRNKQNDSKKAILLLSKIINVKNKSINKHKTETSFLNWLLLGNAYLIIDHPKLAYESYQIALQKAPNFFITWLFIGKLYLELDQLCDALSAYSQVLKLKIENSLFAYLFAWEGLSCVYERCENQLIHASNAYFILSSCYESLGDLKNYEFFKKRAEVLMDAHNNKCKPPPLRKPSEIPNFIIRELILIHLTNMKFFLSQIENNVQP